MVIVDAATSKADSTKDIGFLMDARRACFAFTRARSIFWIVTGTMDGRLNREPTKKKKLGNQDRLVHKQKYTIPVLVEYMQYLGKAGRTFQKSVP